MSENSPQEDLEHLTATMQRIEQLSAKLLELLRSERRALVERALPELESLTAEKALLCAAMDAAIADLGPTPLRHQIAALPEASRAVLEPMHARLLELAGKTQECNAVNGKIVRRSQQSTRELMHLMSGTDTDVLYSAQGYTAQGHPLTRTPGAAIARA